MRYNVQINRELERLNLGVLRVTASRHAMEKAICRGMNIPAKIPTAGYIVELEATGRTIDKIVVRIPGQTIDNVYVLTPMPHSPTWKVITCYTNSHDDNHSTLNMSRIQV